jgi:hypothetical protein
MHCHTIVFPAIFLALICAVQTVAQQGDIDWNRARQLRQRAIQGEKLTEEEQSYLQRAIELRQKQRPQQRRPVEITPPVGQVAWVKQARIAPGNIGEFPKHAEEMQGHMVTVLNMLKDRFPNLRIAYLSSRIYAGYAKSTLNPEPYAYESAFVVRWLIEDQIKGEPSLNYDPDKGAVKSPLLLWGPYFWADGEKGRKIDDLIWKPVDLAGDGTHPKPAFFAVQKAFLKSQ